jgi:DNA-binding XRE family transcriptional regulator
MRREFGITQQELADKAKISVKTLQNYDSGKAPLENASVKTVVTLCNILNCRISDVTDLRYSESKRSSQSNKAGGTSDED